MRMLLSALAAGAIALGAGAPAAKADPYGYGWGGGPGYYRHYHRGGGGDALAAGVVGLAAGALLGSALSQPRPAPTYVDPYYGRPVYAAPAYRAPVPVYVAPPTYEDTYPARRVVRYDNGPRGHIERCFARYRSYDPRSDTYLGFDGYRHLCDQ